ncbi:3-oxo-5-alpha-steroid 4-dehydrogenase [compost metagenome]
MVNRDGKRFCNEEVYGATLGQPLMEEQGGRAWLVLDARLRAKAIRQALFGGYWWFQTVPALALMLFKPRKGKTPTQLAQATGMQVEALSHALQRNNAAARGEAEDEWGKSPGSRQVLDQGPFYACDISVGNPIFPLGALTLGGLKVNEDSGAVLDAQGQAIPGLYAAGRTALGIPSHLYISGLSLADCVFSGRRAGAAIAAQTRAHRTVAAGLPREASTTTRGEI